MSRSFGCAPFGVRGSGAFCDINAFLFMIFDGVRVLVRRWFCPFGQGGHVEELRLTVKPACEGSGGVIRSENVDMSSDKECERHSRRKSKGSCLKLI